MDTWTPEQKVFISKGGNSRLKQVLKEYGVPIEFKTMELHEKYNTKAAEYYRQLLKSECKQNSLKPTPPKPGEGILPINLMNENERQVFGQNNQNQQNFISNTNYQPPKTTSCTTKSTSSSSSSEPRNSFSPSHDSNSFNFDQLSDQVKTGFWGAASFGLGLAQKAQTAVETQVEKVKETTERQQWLGEFQDKCKDTYSKGLEATKETLDYVRQEEFLNHAKENLKSTFEKTKEFTTTISNDLQHVIQTGDLSSVGEQSHKTTTGGVNENQPTYEFQDNPMDIHNLNNDTNQNNSIPSGSPTAYGTSGITEKTHPEQPGNGIMGNQANLQKPIMVGGGPEKKDDFNLFDDFDF